MFPERAESEYIVPDFIMSCYLVLSEFAIFACRFVVKITQINSL